MKILIALNRVAHLTGTELWAYDLGAELVRRGHTVHMLADHYGDIARRTREAGVTLFNFEHPPEDIDYDIIHASHAKPTEFIYNRYPNIPKFVTVHSQFQPEYPYEQQDLLYVPIRPNIVGPLRRRGLKVGPVIYHGVDTTRFNTDDRKNDGFDLFVGTVDQLRAEAMSKSARGSHYLIVVGTRHVPTMDVMQHWPNIEWVDDEVWDIERYVKRCNRTLGIELGRTTIEGWHCGKPGIIYHVSDSGKILDKTSAPVPPKDVLDIFTLTHMVDQYELLYEGVIDGYGRELGRRIEVPIKGGGHPGAIPASAW